jgi:hypothetical protein
MTKILIVDNDLRNLWLYNTWRMRIATGDFVSFVITMATTTTAVTAAGTALFPGAGSIVGWMFGLAGSVAGGIFWLMIPQDAKDGLTALFRDTRRESFVLGNKMAWSGNESTNEEIDKILLHVIKENRPMPPGFNRGFLSPGGRNPHEMAVSITFEKLYQYESHLEALKGMRDIAAQANNQDALRTINPAITEATNHFEDELKFLESSYDEQLKRVDDVYHKYPEFRDPNLIAKYPSLMQMKTYRDNTEKMSEFLKTFAQVARQQMNNDNSDHVYLAVINRFYIFSYSEARLLQVLNSHN